MSLPSNAKELCQPEWSVPLPAIVAAPTSWLLTTSSAATRFEVSLAHEPKVRSTRGNSAQDVVCVWHHAAAVSASVVTSSMSC